MKMVSAVPLVLIASTWLVSCQQSETAATSQKGTPDKPATPSSPAARTSPPPSPFIPSASIQDLMTSIIDPSADYLWDSVAVIGTEDGIEEHQPRTDEEWLEVRRRAITLMEAANLLMIKGRRVVEEGGHLEYEGLEGNLTAAEIQKKIDGDHDTFAALARALNTTTEQALRAIEKRDVDAFLEAGGDIDTACEGCHTVYWYPNQKIPQY